jgi:hypothetical protein
VGPALLDQRVFEDSSASPRVPCDPAADLPSIFSQVPTPCYGIVELVILALSRRINGQCAPLLHLGNLKDSQ